MKVLQEKEDFALFVKNIVKDEFHFALVCPLYSNYRYKYIPDKYYSVPNRNRLNILIVSKNEATVKNLVAYLYHSFQLRKNYISAHTVE